MPLPTKKTEGTAGTDETTASAKATNEETFTPYSEDAEEQAVSAAEVTAVAVPSASLNYDYVPQAEDVTMPRILLLQGNAETVLQGNAKAGDWLLPGGEMAAEFTVDVLGMRRSRIRSLKQAQGSSEPPKVLCQSPDAVQGYGDPGIACSTCPFAQWGPKDPATGKGTPPSCRLRYHYLVETEEGDRAELTINTTTKPAKQAAQAITEGIARWGNGGAFAITMTRKLQETNGNRYFVPVVKSIDKNDTSPPIING